MIIPEQKIQIFISSACGDEPEKQKYNFVREALKTLIESTGFAKVYVFESEGAATTSAGQHYTFALEDCDVCIFLIDNSDGVPLGVQKEIDTAKKHGIKSLFYFCDQSSKEETPLQKSLKGAQYAKSETIHDFKDLIKSGAIDLINDLVMIYKHYCKGRLTWHEESLTEQSADISNVELSIYSDSIAQKDVLTNIDACIEYFTKLILELSYDEVKKTGNIDQLCADFLPVLFEGATINEDSLGLLLLEIEKHQTTQHFTVTKKRYEAIRAYYSGDQKACINKLDEALQIAKQNCLSEWLIKDILIDLRNQDLFLQESRNTYSLNQKYQKELDNSQSLLYYPLLDRLDSNYYEGIIKQAIKYKTETPGTVTFGHGLGVHIKSLTGIYVLAMYNGSLTHLQLLYKRIKLIAFYCATRYSDWNIKKILLKTTIIDGKQKEVDGIIRCFGDLLSKMNENDAYEIYSFSNNRPIAHKRFISKLNAFRITCYYMDDERFSFVWSELYELISKWIEDKNSVTVIGYEIFPTLEGSYLRISQNQLIDIICNCIHNNKRRFYDEIFKLIRKCVSLDEASPENVANLLEVIINIVRNPDERIHIHSLEAALFTLRKKHRELTEELDKIIADEMPDFYNSTYRLETTAEEKTDMPDFLKSYITQVQKDNEEQGKNGTFFGRGNQPHITIKNILQQSTAKFSNELIDSAFEVSSETLLRKNQTIEVKIDAIELLVYLLKSQSSVQERNKNKIIELLSSKPQVEKAQAIITNLNETNLKFSALLLYNCLGEDITVGLLNTLVDIGDDTLSNRKASVAFLNYLEANNSPVPDIQLEHIILQQAIEWCVESDLNIRWNAVQILFLLLRNIENKNVVCNQLVKLMDKDNVYIKNKILRNIHLLKDIDFETFKYIVQKASVDTNYVVRKVVNEIQVELGLLE
ncbi:hypothetical protein CACET_c26830 [Clostridium aceticum]|uniref:Uncharacterized protein n=1 Tax=Clostridium aceticum TaxID=84022 RepID=A0A0D8I632_9CLOT|nr:hypothetical protein [Clostridium aceticum]AKL96128.1 hypothetical protein CACET_c26830 [Clostridium aceticum]KJF25509.1 hypothetical protein TZ02_18050 [Clostridium aceticum]